MSDTETTEATPKTKLELAQDALTERRKWAEGMTKGIANKVAEAEALVASIEAGEDPDDAAVESAFDAPVDTEEVEDTTDYEPIEA